jgi:rod shape-determining protein MreC
MRESRGWFPYALLVLALLLLALHEAGVLTPVENLLGFVVAPVERGLSSLVTSVGDLFQTVRQVRELEERVQALQSENDALKVENIRLREFVAETEQLRRQLQFASENPTFTLVGADVVERGCEQFPCGSVVGVDTNPYLRYLVVNAGSRDGVAIGMPVVTSGSVLIGRVARVSAHLAYIQLLDDPTSKVAAMLQQSRVTGMVAGRSDGALVMTEILPDEKVTEGDIVITSGLGGLMPKGLILGQVATVSYQESALFQEAVLRPALDFRRLEMVLVITNFSPAPAEEINP